MSASDWKLDGRPVPPFIISERELKVTHLESRAPWDYPISLGLLDGREDVAVIFAVDRRRTTNSSPPYKKFMCYSCGNNRQIVTAYLSYTFSGSVLVRIWDEDKRKLLENIDFEHVDITQDAEHDRDDNARLIARHLEMISGMKTVQRVRDLAEKCYFDMLWNVSSFYGIYQGDVPEIPKNWREEVKL